MTAEKSRSPLPNRYSELSNVANRFFPLVLSLAIVVDTVKSLAAVMHTGGRALPGEARSKKTAPATTSVPFD